MTKLLTQPLLISMVLLVAGIVASGMRAAPPKRRAGLLLVSIGTVFLLIFSMPVVGSLLSRSLAIDASSPPVRVEFVVVLSGGYEAGSRPELDVLNADALQRVIAGVLVWKEAPSARMVMTGTVPNKRRSAGRITELMSMAAICRGVPPAAIIREPRARNTREHPVRVLALHGMRSDSRIALVTSSVHERRAMIEFRRYFTHVDAQPVPAPRARLIETWTDWLPQNDGLFASTSALQEWIGIIWYRMLALTDETRTPKSTGRSQVPALHIYSAPA